jgi:predicted deacylase
MNKTIFGILLALMANQAALASEFPFTLHKLKSAEEGPTLLVVGGIQGDEPGGFNAASMLVTDYQITRGEVWVVPNLNFESIIKRSRGVYGDMNRKFLDIPADDPEYQAINKIKGIITSPQVSMVLNLHDGSGFYNSKYIDKDENPRRWGQSKPFPFSQAC